MRMSSLIDHYKKETLIMRVLDAAFVLAASVAPYGMTRQPGQVMTEPRQIVMFDRQGNIVRRVGGPVKPGSMALSPDGTQVALATEGAIRVLTVATGAARKLTQGPDDDQPVWSTDGKRLAFVSKRNGATGIYQVTSDGRGRETLVSAGLGDPVAPGWSSDGQLLAYHANDTDGHTGNDLWLLRVIDGTRIPLLRTPANELGVRISPDGRFIAYRSNATGRPELYVRPFDRSASVPSPISGPSWKVSDQGSVGMVRWRDDSRELYHLSATGEVVAVTISAAPGFKAETTTVLFKVPPEFPAVPGQYSDVSSNGKVFALLVPVRTGGVRP